MIARAGNSPVPFVIHMDHGDSIESIMRAVHVGFTSVMIDGSALPFEENIAKTAEVVNYCHMVGVSVEGELGTIGDTGTSIEGGMTEVIYTNPEDAKKFVEHARRRHRHLPRSVSQGRHPEAAHGRARGDHQGR